MKIFNALLVLLLISPAFVTALELKSNTTITIDWQGNNMFYLRTETGDYLLNASIQDDTSYTINITRHTDQNQTEFEIISDLIQNMSILCMNMSYQFNTTSQYYSTYYRETEANWTRCNLDKNALMEERNSWESTSRNLSESFKANISICSIEKDQYKSTYETCTANYQTASTQLEDEKRSNSQKTILVIILGLTAGILVWQEIQKRGKAHPDEMSLLGQS